MSAGARGVPTSGAGYQLVVSRHTDAGNAGSLKEQYITNC